MRPWRGPRNANVVAPVSERGKTLPIQQKDSQIRQKHPGSMEEDLLAMTSTHGVGCTEDSGKGGGGLGSDNGVDAAPANEGACDGDGVRGGSGGSDVRGLGGVGVGGVPSHVAPLFLRE
jgi:hypothetical protein